MSVKTIINGVLSTMDKTNPLWEDVYLRIENGRICEIGHSASFRPRENEEIIDARHGIVMPGFCNLHTHLPMIPFRGLGDDTVDRLRKFLIPMEKKWMDRELIYLAAKFAIAEELLSGVTTVVDMYYFEEEVMKAAKEMGIRGYFGETLMEEATPSYPSSQEALRAVEEKLLPLQDDKVKVCIAPHGTSTCSEETLIHAKELAEKHGLLFTTHSAEMDYEMRYFKEHYQMTPTAFLASRNLLNKRTLLAHCIHLAKEDILLLHRHEAAIAHCIGANTKSAKGIFPLSECFREGISIGLGTDGPASGNTLDIITQLKLVADFHKYVTGDRSAWPCRDILHLATLGAAQALGQDKEIGSLSVGKKADIIIVETDSVNMFPLYDPHSSLVYSANSSNVRDVFINGEEVVRDKKLVHHQLSELRGKLLAKMQTTEFQPL